MIDWNEPLRISLPSHSSPTPPFQPRRVDPPCAFEQHHHYAALGFHHHYCFIRFYNIELSIRQRFRRLLHLSPSLSESEQVSQAPHCSSSHEVELLDNAGDVGFILAHRRKLRQAIRFSSHDNQSSFDAVQCVVPDIRLNDPRQFAHLRPTYGSSLPGNRVIRCRIDIGLVLSRTLQSCLTTDFSTRHRPPGGRGRSLYCFISKGRITKAQLELSSHHSIMHHWLRL